MLRSIHQWQFSISAAAACLSTRWWFHHYPTSWFTWWRAIYIRFRSEKKRGESAWMEGKHKHKTNARGNKPEKLFISIIKVNSNSMMFAAAPARFSLCNPNKSEGMCEKRKIGENLFTVEQKKREKSAEGGDICVNGFLSLLFVMVLHFNDLWLAWLLLRRA